LSAITTKLQQGNAGAGVVAAVVAASAGAGVVAVFVGVLVDGAAASGVVA
jgi:hypothetical protein